MYVGSFQLDVRYSLNPFSKTKLIFDYRTSAMERTNKIDYERNTYITSIDVTGEIPTLKRISSSTDWATVDSKVNSENSYSKNYI